MALNTSELQRIKAECGFNQLNVGAEPYVSVTRYFEQIVLPNLNAGALASCATSVTAQTVPTNTALTLDDASEINVFDRVIVDVDDAQEEATVQSVGGNTINVRLMLAHSGTYPVSVEGGESMVRLYLRRCREVAQLIEQFGPTAGIRKVDEIEFFGGGQGQKDGFRTLADMQQHFRRELCMLIFGVGDIRNFGGGGQRIAAY